MIQASEIINLGIVLALLPLVHISVRRAPFPQRKVFAWALGFMLLGWIATILEGLFLPDIMDVVDHATTATGGCIFAYGLFATLRRSDLYGNGSS